MDLQLGNRRTKEKHFLVSEIEFDGRRLCLSWHY